MPEKENNQTPEMGAFQEAYPGLDDLARSMMDDYDDESEPQPVVEDDEQPLDGDSAGVVEDSEPDQPSAEVDSAEAGKARKAAKLAGLPESVVEKASDEELVEWYSSHAKSESDVKRAFRENAELRRELDELKATKGAEPAVPTAPEDQELLSLLVEEHGEERGKKMADLITARETRLQARADALEAMLEQRATKAAWDDVSKTLGIEDKAGSYDRVVEQAQSLAKVSGPWTELKGDARVQALFTAAARLVMPDLPSDSELKRRAAISAAKKNGTASAPRQRQPEPPKPKTYSEQVDAKTARILAGERDIGKLRAIGR